MNTRLFSWVEYLTADVPLPGIIIMEHSHVRRGKPSLSPHQKQIRFFIGLFVVVCTLLAILFFWLVNRSSFIPL
jgi:hypothetical protein